MLPRTLRLLTLATTLALAGQATAQIDLHTVHVAPRGDVLVVYSKGFATCGHLMTASQQLVHTQNIFCAQGKNIETCRPQCCFTLFAADQTDGFDGVPVAGRFGEEVAAALGFEPRTR